MGYWGWKPYAPVAKRRARANRAVLKAKKAGQVFSPVVISGRAIATTFWGKAWCDNLQAYSDFANRLPRGRGYVRNGSVIDLQIEPGKVRAQVMGSSLYRIEIGIAAVPPAQWKAIVKDCTGSIASLVELLQGRLSKAVMERLCRPKTGLFPSPREIKLNCSCPDWATMCKHVAAALYGMGTRLDEKPELLFTLRKVDAGALVTQAAKLPLKTKKVSAKGRVLDDIALADVFGIEMAAADVAPRRKTGVRRTKPSTPPAASAKVRAVAAIAAEPAAPPPRKSTVPSAPKQPRARKVATPPASERKSRQAASAATGRSERK